MDDDIWGDITQPQSEECFHFLQNERNYQFNKIYNSGYRDGLEAEVDTILDEEFNKGFKIGALQWKCYSRLLGKIEALTNILTILKSSHQQEADELNTQLLFIFESITKNTIKSNDPDIIEKVKVNENAINENLKTDEYGAQVDEIEQRIIVLMSK